MTLIERINADYLTAFKAREHDKKSFLGVVKGEIQNKAPNPTDENVLKILISINKSLEKSYSLGDNSAKNELFYMSEYLPSQLSGSELTTLIEDFIVSEALNGPQDMGKVMGYLKVNFGGQYDGKLASKIVRETLT